MLSQSTAQLYLADIPDSVFLNLSKRQVSSHQMTHCSFIVASHFKHNLAAFLIPQMLHEEKNNSNKNLTLPLKTTTTATTSTTTHHKDNREKNGICLSCLYEQKSEWGTFTSISIKWHSSLQITMVVSA